ncbi:MAG: HYR domain-containing protein [Saprospiraceae bacterium]|nr:HYR domain-containing protein [Saprospiraceae bacterium]MCB9323647.1 HYR domain-containing protein [Lewinellaceae bacterium]
MATKLLKSVFPWQTIIAFAFFSHFSGIPAYGHSATFAPETFTLDITIISFTNVSCFLGSDGSASAGASGGSGNYAYVWTNGQTTATATGLSAGTASVTVTDLADGATASTSIIINAPPELNATAIINAHVTCFSPVGSASAIVTGGTPNYQYHWQNGETTQTAVNLSAGNQSLTVTDANGCIFIEQFTILADTAAPIADAGIDVSKDCNNPGPQFTLNGSGSSQGANYSFLWFTANGNIVSGITSLNPVVDELGTYTLLVTNNANGCSATDAVVVYENFEAPVADAGSSVAICEGECYLLTASATQGSLPYTYVWADGVGTGSSIEVCPTNTTAYTVTVTGSNGCSSADQMTISVFSNPSLDVFSIDCSSDVLTYTVHITTNANQVTATEGEITNLGNGFFRISEIPIDTASVTITATNTVTSCASQIFITPPGCGCPDIEAPSSGGDRLICEGDMIPFLTVTPPTGMVIDWYDAPSGGNLLLSDSSQFMPAEEGSYYAASRNPSSGCVSDMRTLVALTISEIPDVSILLDGQFCEGSCGILTAVGDGLTQYAWSSGQTSASIFVCQPETYSVTVANFNGCTNHAEITITPFPAPIADAGPEVTFNCVFTETTIGGTGSSIGTGISYSWSNGATTPTQVVNEPGTYFLTVTNTETHCFATDVVLVTQDTLAPVAQGGEDIFLPCTTGQTILNGSATPAFSTLSWTLSDTTFFTGTIFVQDTGTYILIAENQENGCIGTDTVVVFPSSIPDISILSISDVLCNGGADGTVTFEIEGGNDPFEYTGLNLQNTGLPAGSYSFTVLDAAGCEASTSVIISEPPPMSIATSSTSETGNDFNDGTASAAAFGGTPGYSYLWSTGGTTPTINNLAPGDYSVTASDANGCTIVSSVTVSSFDCGTLEPAVNGITSICPGSSSGSLEITTIVGGAAPFSFDWSTGSTDNHIEQLSGGTYGCTLTDAEGCEQILSFDIVEEDTEAPVLVTQNITIFLDESGTASFLPSDINGGSTDNCGIDSFYVNINHFECEDIGDNLIQAVVFDTGNLSDTATVVVTVEDTIPPVFVLCPGDIVTENCSEVEYALPSATDNCSTVDVELMEGELSGSTFPVGTTEVLYMASDVSGNLASCSFNVTVAPTLSASVALSPASCEGLPITATLIPEGGAPPYSYFWNTGATIDHLTFYVSASVSWTVTDSVGCSYSEDLSVDFPAMLGLDIVTTPEIDMNNNGWADATISGGTPPYEYVWSIQGGPIISIAEDLENVVANTYCLLVTDANGCEITDCAVVDQVTATNDTELRNRITILPNPVSEWLYINFNLDENTPGQLILFSMNGHKILRQEKSMANNQVMLNMKGFPEGIYWLKIIIDKKVFWKKIMVIK